MDTDKHPKLRVKWYRCPVSREDLRELNRRNNLKGFCQTGGFLGLLLFLGGLSWYSAVHWPWYVTITILFAHGTCWQFLGNGFHELVHDSVFKTRFLNTAFLRLFSFLNWSNHHQYWASHTEHHKYTLHPPEDLEVVLPIHHTFAEFVARGFIFPQGLYYKLKGTIRVACGKVDGPWMNALFPVDEPDHRRQLANWARILLLGHGVIVVASIAMGWWILPVIITLAPFYGGALYYLCNNSQHVGLMDNVSDYRLCVRTIYLNPLFRFLYWNMNYHTEHHMYPAVPCYNLARLHNLIKHDMPCCPNGLYATWKQIAEILKKQKLDPSYQYAPNLPTPAEECSAQVSAAKFDVD